VRALVRCLQSGGIVAHPTEGVFGLGCDPFDTRAVARVIALKRRDGTKGLIVLGARVEHFAGLVHAQDLGVLPKGSDRPTTYVVRAAPGAPVAISGGRDTVAIRLCAHPPVAMLCTVFGRAIVSTSANFSGGRPVMSGLAAHLLFGQQLDGVMSNRVGDAARPSRIVDLSTGNILRD
jgi:L-threonylcarbamoyladenylate synthase